MESTTVKKGYTICFINNKTRTIFATDIDIDSDEFTFYSRNKSVVELIVPKRNVLWVEPTVCEVSDTLPKKRNVKFKTI